MQKTSYLKIRWENNETQRYYEARVGRDLFGWVVTRVWGRKGTALGRVTHRPCNNFEDGKCQVTLINRQRQRRGYLMVMQEGVQLFCAHSMGS